MNKVYHGSPIGDIKELVPKKSTHMEEYVYATVSPVIALIFSVENLGDLDHDIMLKDGKVIFTERREGAFEKYNTSGYLHELDGTNFKHISNIWDAEVVSTEKEKVQKCYYIENVLHLDYDSLMEFKSNHFNISYSIGYTNVNFRTYEKNIAEAIKLYEQEKEEIDNLANGVVEKYSDVI